jgi:filamentous hemagglutinin family protein
MRLVTGSLCVLLLPSVTFAAATPKAARSKPLVSVARQSRIILNSDDGTVTRSGRRFLIRPSTSQQTNKNLFFNFSRFDVAMGADVLFEQGTTLPDKSAGKNIFGLIHGGPAFINGTLRAATNSHLFLIDPDGLHFGRHAEVGRGVQRVTVATANSIRFDDGSLLSTSSSVARPSGEPTALDFSSSGPLVIDSAAIRTADAKSNAQPRLTIAGSSINARDRARIQSLGGLVTLAAVKQGELYLGGQNWQAVTSRGPVYLQGGSFVDISSDRGAIVAPGRIDVVGEAVVLSANPGATDDERSILRANTVKESNQTGGDILLNATGAVSIYQGATVIAASTRTDREAPRAGHIDVVAQSFMAEGAATPKSASGLLAFSNAGPPGAARVTTSGAVSFTRGASINTSGGGTKAGGSIVVHTPDQITLEGGGSPNETGFFARGQDTVPGIHDKSAGGTITVSAGSLLLSNRGRISVSGTREAGVLTLNVDRDIRIDGNDDSTLGNETGLLAIGHHSSRGGTIDVRFGHSFVLDRQAVIDAAGKTQGGILHITGSADNSLLDLRDARVHVDNGFSGGDVSLRAELLAIGNDTVIDARPASRIILDGRSLLLSSQADLLSEHVEAKGDHVTSADVLPRVAPARPRAATAPPPHFQKPANEQSIHVPDRFETN